MEMLKRRVDSPIGDNSGGLPVLQRRKLPLWVRFRRWLAEWLLRR